MITANTRKTRKLFRTSKGSSTPHLPHQPRLPQLMTLHSLLTRKQHRWPIRKVKVESLIAFVPLSEEDSSKFLLSSHATTPLDPNPSKVLHTISPTIMAAITHDEGLSGFRYIPSQVETTGQFCNYLRYPRL